MVVSITGLSASAGDAVDTSAMAARTAVAMSFLMSTSLCACQRRSRALRGDDACHGTVTISFETLLMEAGATANVGPILVVEDDAKIAQLVRAYLEREGFTVATAADGLAALAAVRRLGPRLIVLDLMLPELDGMSVARRVREESDTPILMLSARASIADRVHGISEGADDYLSKPFSPAELVVRVKAILRRSAGARASSLEPLRLDDLLIDRARHEVLRSGRRIALTTVEFRLLGARVTTDGPEEIASLARSFNRMAERLEEHERERTDFVANAAHELRTPLTNLQGYLEALRDGVVEPSRESFASLHEEADRLVRLARSLDDLARGDLEGGAPRRRSVDLYAAVAASVELVAPVLERRGVALEVRVPAALTGSADPDHLAQVLANLLQNAVRYTPEGGRVSVSAERQNGQVRIAVANTGDGIPPTELERVFERFYRVEKSRDRSRGGAGIGLAIVKQLVELGGGRVGAESRAGTTRIWFSLPDHD